MSAKIDILLNALWCVHPVLAGAIATAMVRRGQHRVFRYFFAYVAAQIPIFALTLPVYVLCGRGTLFYVDSCCTAVSVVLGFLAIQEAFLDVSGRTRGLRDLDSMLFKWAAVVLLLVAGILSISRSSAHATLLEAVIVALRSFVRIVQIGMALFLLFFAHHIGASWRRQSFGIALGFATFTLAELALFAAWKAFNIGEAASDSISLFAYNAALLIWLRYSLANAPAREGAVTVLPPRRHGESFAGIHQPVSAHLPIPMFETVGTDTLSSVAMSQPADAADTELKTACDMFIAAYKNIEAKYPDLATEIAQPHEAITDYIRTQIHN